MSDAGWQTALRQGLFNSLLAQCGISLVSRWYAVRSSDARYGTVNWNKAKNGTVDPVGHNIRTRQVLVMEIKVIII